MPRKALSSWDDQSFQARRQAQIVQQKQFGNLKSKTFDQLSADEKDMLLKQVALRLGLISGGTAS
jgi:hypothetical protein